MNKLLLAVSLVCIGYSGCAVHTSGPIQGLIYKDVILPDEFHPDASSVEPGDVLLGRVEGRSTAQSYFGLFAFGDASLESAYRLALAQVQGATRLVDVAIDYEGMNVLGLYAEHTTIVRGMAVAGISPHADTGAVGAGAGPLPSDDLIAFRELKLHVFRKRPSIALDRGNTNGPE